MLKKIFIFSCIIIGINSSAQNHIDALRYSKESLWGSARHISMGGAFGSLGANANSSSHNPAGIATYTTNEFSGSLDFLSLEKESKYFTNNSFDSKSKVSIPNLNYINANVFDPEDIGDWSRFNFGIGYNKLDDYNKNTTISAEQNEQSFSDIIYNSAEGNSFDELNTFDALLGFNTYLIDTIGGTSSYLSSVRGDMNKIQTFSSQESGSKNEFYISFGTAYQNRLFIGATIGFPGIDYTQYSSIREDNFSGNDDEIIDLEYFDYNTNLYVSGSGINLKLGLIYQLDNQIRYGFALHTPTYYEIHEEYWSSINTEFTAGESYYSESSLGVFDYRLNTPFKVINSLSCVIRKTAIISLDFEYLDYSMANISSDFYNFNSVNNDIESYYTSSSNLKIGAELKIHPQLSLRGGYAYYGSPFTGELNDSSQEYVTMGMGLKVNQYFFDLALLNSTSKESLYIYQGSNSANISSSRGSLLFSTGFKF
jgi:hypothetical protein